MDDGRSPRGGALAARCRRRVKKDPGSLSLISLALDLRRRTEGLSFGPPVAHVYHPLEYAWETHGQYLERYGGGKGRVLLLGMNPGPWGMTQTGVPFGDVSMVRDWLRIQAPIGKPRSEHPACPIRGFACPRPEVSGRRFWGWARDRCGAPERFFERFFVWNYCPLVFLEGSGRNRTPDQLPAREREPLVVICDESLLRAAAELEPTHVVGIGRFAERRARRALAGRSVPIGCVPHPSPANPQTNEGWARLADRALRDLGIELPEPAPGP